MAGTACAEGGIAGLRLDMAGAIAAAREMGASGWMAAELLTALRIGMDEGAGQRKEEKPTDG